MTQETHTDWKAYALTLVREAVTQSGGSLLTMVQEKVDATTHAIIARIVTVAVALLGGALLCIGIALYLGMLLGAAAYGFMIMGATLLAVAVLLRIVRA